MKVRDIVMREDAKITKSDGSGVEITADDGVKTTLPADKAAALMPDPEKPGEYDFNPQAVSQTASSGQPEGPKVGANVEIKTAEDSATPVGEIPDSVTLDSADGFKDALRKAGEQSGVEPETLAGIDKIVVTDADGSVNVNATLKNTLQLLGEASVQFVQFYKDLLNAMIKGTQSPEFAQVDPEAKQSVIDAINDMKKQLPVFEREAAALQAQIQAAQKDPEVTRIQELAGTAPSPAPAPAAAPQVDPKNWKVPSIDFLKKNYQHPADVIDGASPSTTDPERIGAWPPDSDFADLLMALDASYYQARQADPNFQQPGFVKDDWELVQRLLSTPEGKEYAIANWIGLADVNDKSAEAEFNRAQHKEFEKQRNERDMAKPDGVYTPGWKYDQKLGTTPVQADLQKQKQAQAAQPAPQVAKESAELSALLKIAGLR